MQLGPMTPGNGKYGCLIQHATMLGLERLLDDDKEYVDNESCLFMTSEPDVNTPENRRFAMTILRRVAKRAGYSIGRDRIMRKAVRP